MGWSKWRYFPFSLRLVCLMLDPIPPDFHFQLVSAKCHQVEYRKGNCSAAVKSNTKIFPYSPCFRSRSTCALRTFRISSLVRISTEVTYYEFQLQIAAKKEKQFSMNSVSLSFQRDCTLQVTRIDIHILTQCCILNHI